ncbi:hypothetical protein D3C71_1641350 [compost metagenome]
MGGQERTEVVLGHEEDCGVLTRKIIMGPLPAVEDRDVAEPAARFHVGERAVPACTGGGAHAHGALRASHPMAVRVAACGNPIALHEAAYEDIAKNVVAKRSGE